jgi:hypothetical protein
VHIKLFKSVILLPQTLNKCQEFSLLITDKTGIAVTDEMQIIASGLTTVSSATAITFERIFLKKVEAVLIEKKQMNGLPSESASIIKVL